MCIRDRYKCFFFIADWHSLTTHPHPGNVVENVRKILAEYLACGLDPEKATIYVQSDIKEIAELYLYLNMNADVYKRQVVMRSYTRWINGTNLVIYFLIYFTFAREKRARS